MNEEQQTRLNYFTGVMAPLLERVSVARNLYSVHPSPETADAVIHRLEDALAQSQENLRQVLHG